MFGCVICIYIKQLQITLNSLRTRHSSNKHYYMTIIFHHGKSWIISTIRDYAGRIFINFYLEVQSEHFGSWRSLSIEGCNLEIVDE